MSEPPPRRCLECGYIVEGLSINRCPECGTGFDPTDPTTFDRDENTAPSYLRNALGLAGAQFCAACLFIVGKSTPSLGLLAVLGIGAWAITNLIQLGLATSCLALLLFRRCPKPVNVLRSALVTSALCALIGWSTLGTALWYFAFG